MQCFWVYKDSIQTWQRPPKKHLLIFLLQIIPWLLLTIWEHHYFMLRHKSDANFSADSSFSKEKFFYIARQKGNTNILQEHRWSFVQLQKNSAKSISLHRLHQCTVGRTFSATKSVQCTMCTLCTAQCAPFAQQRQLIFALWIVLYLHIFLGVDNIYEYIFSGDVSSSAFTTAHSTQSKSIDFCPSSY